MLTDYIGEKLRIIDYKNNEVQIDLICKELTNDIVALFSNYKFIGHHKTQVTHLNVIELNATDENKGVS